MAKKFFAGQNPIGRRYRPEEGNKLGDLVEIIGVVKDAKYVALREDIQPTAYLAGSQNANPDQSNTFELYVAAGAPTTVISAHAWVIGNDGDRIESKRLPNAPSRKGHMESTARGATAVWTRVRARGCWWGGERARFAGWAGADFGLLV